MRKKILATIGLVILFGAGAVPARSEASRISSTQEQQREVAITIYNGNWGLVKDVRELTLGPGGSEVRFMDVASQIDPTTVHLKSLTDPTGLRILEQNYEYDLLNPQKLLDKFVGKSVKLMTSDGTLVDAILLSNNNGPIYKINGQIHLGH